MPHPSVDNLIEDEAELERIVRSMKSVAVLGMKGELESDAPAFTVPRALQRRGIRIIPVNPKLAKLDRALGERVFATLAEVGEAVDVLDVFRRSELVPQHADEVLALPQHLRPAVFWMQSGVRNDAAAEKLAREGVRVVQDRCLSVYAALYRR